MARFSKLAGALDFAQAEYALVVDQGDRAILSYRFKDEDGNAPDVSLWTATVSAEFVYATYGEQPRPSLTNIDVPDPQPTFATPTVEKSATERGVFNLIVPTNLYEGEIAFNEYWRVPVVVAYLRVATGPASDNPPVKTFRLPIVSRRAK